MTNGPDTRTDRMVRRLKDHPVVAVVLAAGFVIVSLSQFTSAFDALLRVFRPGPPASLTSEYCLLLAPLAVQLDRTKDAFERWNERNLPLETQTIRDGNLKARKLLEERSQLVPEELQPDRRKLVQHYDRWLEEYQRLREGPEAKPDEPFVFVGPEGYPFPVDSEQRFRARLERVKRDLGGQPACPAVPAS